jgi:hypothetical protein
MMDSRVVAGLPAGLAPPVSVALARAVTKMPRAGALPGTLAFEAKWDGYRCIAIRDNNGASLWSRQGKDLTRYFPELTEAIAAAVPPGCVVDGEAVIWSGDRLDFSALQQRLRAGPKALPGLVREAPANYVAFDVLAVAGHDARDLPLHQRRTLLEELATGWEPPLSLSPTTTDPDVAAQWFEELPRTGIEGLIIKGTPQPYNPRGPLVAEAEAPGNRGGRLRGGDRADHPALKGRGRAGPGRGAADRRPLQPVEDSRCPPIGQVAPATPLRTSLARHGEGHGFGQVQPRQGTRRADARGTGSRGSLRRHGLVRPVLPPRTPPTTRTSGVASG